MQLQLYGKRIWLYRKAIDFRKSIDGLSYLISAQIKQPLKEGIYIFFNRGCDKLKCLSWHKNGFVMIYKRLEHGRFCFNFNETTGVIEIGANEISWLMAGLDWQKMREWKELNYDKFS